MDHTLTRQKSDGQTHYLVCEQSDLREQILLHRLASDSYQFPPFDSYSRAIAARFLVRPISGRQLL